MLCGIPELLSYGRPLSSELVAARAEGVDILRREQVGGLGSRLLDHLSQALRVFKHRARAQMVVVERLTVPICLEERTLERLDECLFADVGVRVVYEHAGLDIACGVDMEIVSACLLYTSDAADD